MASAISKMAKAMNTTQALALASSQQPAIRPQVRSAFQPELKLLASFNAKTWRRLAI